MSGVHAAATLVLVTALSACRGEVGVGVSELSAGAPSALSEQDAAAPEPDEAARCAATRETLRSGEGRPYGVGPLEERRAEMLGRARGGATLFWREPKPLEGPSSEATEPDEKAREGAKTWFEKQPVGTRVVRLAKKLARDKKTLRSILLREGYLYADDPLDAFELEARIELTDLFDEDRLELTRGVETQTLVRVSKKPAHYVEEASGKTARVLFADRVSIAGEMSSPPLHMDLLEFKDREGFDRLEVEWLSEEHLLGTLRFGSIGAPVVLSRRGAKLEVECWAQDADGRRAVQASREASRTRQEALKNVRAAASAIIDEALPFDRPRQEKGPDRDGELRPHWFSAYRRGSTSYEVDGATYPVFLPDGRPSPPQVCVDFVLESYERGAGSWFLPRGEAHIRTQGALDFSSFGIKNRRGVLGLQAFATERADVFETRTFSGKERIPFQNRQAFFKFLSDNAETFHEGDVVAIHGLKRDDRVHQHAILLERTDPITGFPFGLADQMSRPRRRTWEGIMAEAPKRSLLYRARPVPAIFDAIARSDGPASLEKK